MAAAATEAAPQARRSCPEAARPTGRPLSQQPRRMALATPRAKSSPALAERGGVERARQAPHLAGTAVAHAGARHGPHMRGGGGRRSRRTGLPSNRASSDVRSRARRRACRCACWGVQQRELMLQTHRRRGVHRCREAARVTQLQQQSKRLLRRRERTHRVQHARQPSAQRESLAAAATAATAVVGCAVAACQSLALAGLAAAAVCSRLTGRCRRATE
eukprot:355169-Chlamydomonas_euryale.AAC.4